MRISVISPFVQFSLDVDSIEGTEDGPVASYLAGHFMASLTRLICAFGGMKSTALREEPGLSGCVGCGHESPGGRSTAAAGAALPGQTAEKRPATAIQKNRLTAMGRGRGRGEGREGRDGGSAREGGRGGGGGGEGLGRRDGTSCRLLERDRQPHGVFQRVGHEASALGYRDELSHQILIAYVATRAPPSTRSVPARRRWSRPQTRARSTRRPRAS